MENHKLLSHTMPHLLSAYALTDSTYDEMWLSHSPTNGSSNVHAEAQIKPHWESMMENIEKIGVKELKHRHLEVQRLLKENGVSYNIHGDPHGLNRPWKLDLIPMLLEEEDWKSIEKGVVQRAYLLDLILKDIYGEQKLIKNGLLPFELIYQHNGFLRACAGIKKKGGQELLIYAADMARGPDGNMWVINDRTQAPSGSGYALENRASIKRALPDLFHGIQVRRISGFFQSFRAKMVSLSPRQQENPRIVMLTPGSKNETYFEQAYLAAFMGFILVQGNDLVVRDGHVWLKSLKGLQKVDVIVRRVDDSFCDPLELRADSQLGIAGLLEVVRKGNVVVANPLGSSVLENPALRPFLQGISRYFLGEDLLLPTIATWWCGQPKELQFVLDNISRLIIKNIDKTFKGEKTIFGKFLSTHQIRDLKAKIKTQPHFYIGQEQVDFSTSPTFVDGKLEPRYSVLRSFLVAHQDSYVAMPGGLTRIAPEKGSFFVSNQAGGLSKDTWVLGKEPSIAFNGLITRASDISTMPSTTLTSRSAENLFWTGRYAERVLGTARLLRIVLKQLTETSEFSTEADKEASKILLCALTHFTMTYPGFVKKRNEKMIANPKKELLSVIFDENKVGSLAFTINMLNSNISTLRDRWSQDTWRVFGVLDERWKSIQEKKHLELRHLRDAMDDLVTSLVAFIGLNEESMEMDAGRLVYDSGRRIEYSLLLNSFLRATLVFQTQESVEYILMESTLSFTECLSTYRFRFRSSLQLVSVLEMLLLDPKNPRSLIFQINGLYKNFEEMPKKKNYEGQIGLTPEQKSVLQAYTTLNITDIYSLIQTSNNVFIRKSLDELLAQMSNLIGQTSSNLANNIFDHTELPRAIGQSSAVQEL